MNILLINPPIRENEPPRHIPIGLGILTNVLLNEGNNVNILDINAERLNNSAVYDRINLNSKYDIIGVGGLLTTYKYMKWLIPELKKFNPDSIIIIGGGAVTENPTLLLSKTVADIAVIGEGEITMKELTSHMEKNKSLETVNGIAYKENNKIKITPPRPLIKNLDVLPYPAYESFPIDIYLKNVAHAGILGKESEMGIITSRGCPFNCRYCYHIFGRGVRTRSIENVVGEIKYLINKFKVESLLILDETFTLNKRRVMEFCNVISQEKIDIPWSCYARVNLVDREILSRMKKTGCYRVGYGIESGSQKILDLMNKKVTIEQAKEAIKLTRKAGLICGTTWMFGYPGEDYGTIQETIDFCKDLKLSPKFFYTTPYPGSELYIKTKDKILEKYGDEEKYILTLGDVSDFTVNLTEFTDEELMSLKKDTENQLRQIPLSYYPELLLTRYKQYGIKRFVKKGIKKLHKKS